MKAAVLYQRRGQMIVEDVDIQPPDAGEVQIQIAATGVCHSDYHHWENEFGSTLPLVLGHEVSGIVHSVGRGVTRVKPGDHVILAFGNRCGECFYCQRGEPFICTPNADSPLLSRGPRIWKGSTPISSFLATGGFANYTVVPQGNVIPIPNEVPLDLAALVGCAVATGFGAVVNAAKVQAGANVLVIGCGGVGLNVIQSAALAGAARIIAVDIRDNKLELARMMGASHTINAANEDVIPATKALTGGYGVDYAFEAISHPKTIAQAYYSLRKGGTAVIVGMSPLDSKLDISPLDMMRTARTLIGTAYGNVRPQSDFPKLIDLFMQGKLKLDELVSRRFALSEINDAFRALGGGEVARGIVVYD